MEVVVPTPQVVEMVEVSLRIEETLEEEDPYQTRVTGATTQAKAMTIEVHHRPTVPVRLTFLLL